MIAFLDGDAISAKIIQIIKEADNYLLLISPYIKLTEKIKTEMAYLVKQKPEVEVVIVFGKNENNTEKSLSLVDYSFLKTLPNIRISYVKDLHAKIYCSEDRLMLSSMNLHGYSQANNFEAAFIIEEMSLVNSLVNKSISYAWDQAFTFVEKIIVSSTCVYKKGKVYKTKFFGFSSEVIEEYFEDNSASFYQNKIGGSIKLKGYCIRTGIEIPFDLKQPFDYKSFKSWQNFSNPNYPERYCHYSGEESNGETTFKSPILRKNWKEAKSKFKF